MNQKNLSEDTFRKVLELFVRDSWQGGWMNTPFTIGSQVFATDGKAIIAFDKSLAHGSPELKDADAQKIASWMSPESNTHLRISIANIKHAFEQAPKIEGIEDGPESVTCRACYGTGEVTWTFDHEMEEYELEETCPVCDGFGRLDQSSNKLAQTLIVPAEFQFKIGSSQVQFRQLKRIVDAADILEKGEIKLFRYDPIERHILFKIGEATLLQMPVAEWAHRDDAPEIKCES